MVAYLICLTVVYGLSIAYIFKHHAKSSNKQSVAIREISSNNFTTVPVIQIIFDSDAPLDEYYGKLADMSLNYKEIFSESHLPSKNDTSSKLPNKVYVQYNAVNFNNLLKIF